MHAVVYAYRNRRSQKPSTPTLMNPYSRSPRPRSQTHAVRYGCRNQKSQRPSKPAPINRYSTPMQNPAKRGSGAEIAIRDHQMAWSHSSNPARRESCKICLDPEMYVQAYRRRHECLVIKAKLFANKVGRICHVLQQPGGRQAGVVRRRRRRGELEAAPMLQLASGGWRSLCVRSVRS